MKQKILNQVNKLFKNDGIHDTLLNGVKIYTTSKYDTLSPFREPLIINYQEHFSNLSRNFS